MFKDEGDFHASVFIWRIGDNQQLETVLIRDTLRGSRKWKFPGGTKNLRKDLLQPLRDEHPAETAARELKEETGLIKPAKRMVHVHTATLATHKKHYFMGRKNSFRKLRTGLSKEYEEAKPFSVTALHELADFHRDYYRVFLMIIEPILKNNFSGQL